jgi:DNA-binding response OmpR family regulator
MNKKILIVEDNVDLCEIYKIAFESKKFEVQVEHNGMNAVNAVSSFKPDIILLDIMMPYVSGHDFLKTIRGKGNKTMVVINSNLSQEADVKKSLDLGADYYLKKAEYTPKEVVEKVEEFLNKKEN